MDDTPPTRYIGLTRGLARANLAIHTGGVILKAFHLMNPPTCLICLEHPEQSVEKVSFENSATTDREHD